MSRNHIDQIVQKLYSSRSGRRKAVEELRQLGEPGGQLSIEALIHIMLNDTLPLRHAAAQILREWREYVPQALLPMDCDCLRLFHIWKRESFHIYKHCYRWIVIACVSLELSSIGASVQRSTCRFSFLYRQISVLSCKRVPADMRELRSILYAY